jgi:hypothetical protein
MTQFLIGASLTDRIAGDAKRELRQVEPHPLRLRQPERAPRREENLPELREQARSLPERLASGERRASAVAVYQV